MATSFYTKVFFTELRAGSIHSAEAVVPIVMKLMPCASVVDVGCGEGTWLAVFRSRGVEEILGLDGDYVERDQLQIPPECFRAFDLSKPLSIERTFDLAVSVEVAEHLPPESAETFVQSLTRLAPAVLFSAAIPFQGGNHHVNERWPDEWAKLFERFGYLPVDCIRRRVWEIASVDWWYAQNTLLYVKPELFESNPALRFEYEHSRREQLRLVHPRQYLHLQQLYREAAAPGLKTALQTFVASLKRSVTWRLRWTRAMPNRQQLGSDVAATQHVKSGP